MNSFIGISKAQTTNFAAVAPGLAEALLATAMGLFTARRDLQFLRTLDREL
jgi:biopolymer transport protein ExbB